MIARLTHAATSLARRAWLGQQVARSNAARASAQLVRQRRQVEEVLDYLDAQVRDRRPVPAGRDEAAPAGQRSPATASATES